MLLIVISWIFMIVGTFLVIFHRKRNRLKMAGLIFLLVAIITFIPSFYQQRRISTVGRFNGKNSQMIIPDDVDEQIKKAIEENYPNAQVLRESERDRQSRDNRLGIIIWTLVLLIISALAGNIAKRVYDKNEWLYQLKKLSHQIVKYNQAFGLQLADLSLFLEKCEARIRALGARLKQVDEPDFSTVIKKQQKEIVENVNKLKEQILECGTKSTGAEDLNNMLHLMETYLNDTVTAREELSL